MYPQSSQAHAHCLKIDKKKEKEKQALFFLNPFAVGVYAEKIKRKAPERGEPLHASEKEKENRSSINDQRIWVSILVY